MKIPPQLEARLEHLLAETLVDAHDEDAQLMAFSATFEELLGDSMGATVLGQPVEVVAIRYPAGPLRGLTADCALADGSRHEIALVDLRTPGAYVLIPGEILTVTAQEQWTPEGL